MFVVDWRNVYRKIERCLNEYEKIDDDEKDKNVRWNNDYYYEEEYYVKLLVDGMDLFYAGNRKYVMEIM